MNKKLSMAVAGAVLAFGASAANAGITIPAGDWTVDIGGNVNAYYTNTQVDTTVRATGAKTSAADANTIGTGLLPAAFGIGAKTRQNDLDIAFQFSFFTGTSSGDSLGGGAAGNNSLNIRQAFLTFGDASWGTIKAGRDLGIFGSDAILSDMTLLGVGTGGPAGGSSTLGRIGSGYIYADWKGQISYASPNWNGFAFAAGVMENFNPATAAQGAGPATGGTAGNTNNDNMDYEGKVTYDFAASDVTGRVWLSGISQKTESTVAGASYTSNGFDIGAKAAYQGFGLVGYYYDGKGMGVPAVAGANVPLSGLLITTSDQDVDGGYVQGTFTIPGVGTKLGASWGRSNIDGNAGAADFENESWIIGAYHPLTKSLNIVAEYTDADYENIGNVANADGGAKTIALGAIMFF
jgi:predicted porin